MGELVEQITAQLPAKGIFEVNKWGSSVMYKAICSCGDDKHSHTLDIEADDDGTVSVIIYTTTKSKWWQFTRWQKMWSLLTKGYVEHEAAIIMDKQVALNYAETLKSAICECERLVTLRKGKHEQT